ncbi:hypothetical protein ABVT39_001091 [Epinephelus coioides]
MRNCAGWQHEIISDIVHEIISAGGNTEAARKAPGVKALMTQFEVHLGLKICLQLFSAAEEVARIFQTKDISTETVQSSVNMLSAHYRGLRPEVSFHRLYADAQNNTLIQAPVLPPVRRPPRRLDDGAAQHEWRNPEMYRRQFFEVLDLLKG